MKNFCFEFLLVWIFLMMVSNKTKVNYRYIFKIGLT